MEIEVVAAHTPEKIIREAIDPAVGFQGYNGRNIAFALGLPAMEAAVMTPSSRCWEPLSPVHGQECGNG